MKPIYIVNVGQGYWVKPAFIGAQPADDQAQIGKVVWVHPKQRFAVLEFDGIYGKPRECFQLSELTRPVSRRKRKEMAA